MNGSTPRRLAGAVLLIASMAMAHPSFAQSAGQGDANANIVFGISILNTADLSFGQVISPPAAGTVSITTTPDSTAWSQGGTLPTFGGVVQPAAFTVSKVGIGGGSPKFWVEIPSSLTLIRSGGGASMVVDGFNANAAPVCVATTGGTAAGPQGQCPSADGYNLLVGGTLHVGAGQMTGSYSGTFAVTVHRY